MHILIVTQYYPPETAFIAPSLAEGLAARGHSVRVLTAFPNYPAGEIYNGYRQSWRMREVINGIEVCRVPIFIDHSQNPARRMLNYLSFGFSSATARRFARGADVVYVYATQMTPALGPWIWRAFGGAPYVVHVQDLWPDSITGSSLVRRGAVLRVIERVLTPWLRSVYRRAAAVIAIAPRMQRTLAQRGARHESLHQIYNWAPEAPGRAVGRRRAEGEAVAVLYAGNIGDMQDLETAVRAAHLVGSDKIVLRIVGSGVALPRVRELADSLGTTNVEFLGRVSREDVPALYARADYSLITLKDLPVFEQTIPSKFQASLAHSLPVITAVAGDVKQIVEAHDIGFTAAPEDPESLAAAFERATATGDDDRGRMAARAQELYLREFSFSSALDRIESVMQRARRERRGR